MTQEEFKAAAEKALDWLTLDYGFEINKIDYEVDDPDYPYANVTFSEHSGSRRMSFTMMISVDQSSCNPRTPLGFEVSEDSWIDIDNEGVYVTAYFHRQDREYELVRQIRRINQYLAKHAVCDITTESFIKNITGIVAQTLEGYRDN